jgi:hypothetical protein
MDQIEQLIDKKIKDAFRTYRHTHNRVDSLALDPKYFLGFPVIQVVDATVAPTDKPQNGTFRFYVDPTPVYKLWAYLIYTNSSGVLVAAWKSVALT